MEAMSDPAGQAALLPIIIALVALVRSVWVEMPNRLRPVLPVLVAMGIYVIFGPGMGWDSREILLHGLETGLASAGLLRAGKVILKDA